MAEFNFTYRAFISYAHADREWAVWLHRALERYRVPQRLAGAGGVRRLGRLFRDEEELAAAAELGPKIDAALKSSDALIVVCSPRSAKSKWVGQEIEAFKRLGREARVFALIVDGEPHGAGATDCFPEALKTTAEGGVAEPLAVDVRKFGREDAVLRLVAGLLDVGYDDLRQREHRRRRAELLRAQALFTLGVILTVAALTGGWFAAANYVDSSERKSELLAREANTAANEGNSARAILAALYADPGARAGPVEQALRPNGYRAARDALTRAVTGSLLLRRFPEQSSAIVSASVSDDGSNVLATLPGRALYWPVAGGKSKDVPVAMDQKPATAIAFSPDGKAVLAGYDNGMSLLWPVKGGTPEPIASLSGGVSAVAFSQSGRLVLIGGDSTAELRRLPRDVLATFSLIDRKVVKAVISPDDKYVLVVTDMGVAIVWPIADVGNQAKLTPDQGLVLNDGNINAATFSGKSEYVVTGEGDGSIRVWSIAGKKLLRQFNAATSQIIAVTGSQSSNNVLVGAQDGTAKIWNWSTGELMATLGGHAGPVTAVSFAQNGKLTLTGSSDGATLLWPAENLLAPRVALADRPASQVIASPNRLQVAALRGGNIQFQSTSGVTLESSIDAFDINAIAYSPDSKKLLVGSHRGAVKLWPIAGDEDPIEFEDLGGEASIVTFSPSGGVVLAGSKAGELKLWTATGGKPVATLQKNGSLAQAAAFTLDGKTLVTGHADGTVKVWRLDSLTSSAQPVATIAAHSQAVESIDLSPDGQRVLTGSADGSAHIWPIAGGPALATMVPTQPTGDPIVSAALAPDGQTVLTGSYYGTISLWSASSSALLATFGDRQSPIYGLYFNADGKSFTALAGDSSARVWRIPNVVFASAEQQISLACRMLRDMDTKQLTDADYNRIPILDRKEPNPCTKTWAAQ